MRLVLQRIATQAVARPQQRLKKIVLATDFSEHAENALQYAISLAAESGAELVLFHSVGVPVSQPEMLVNPIGLLEKISQDRLAKLVQEVEAAIVEQGFPPIRVRSAVKAGFPSENVIQFAAEEKADLLVVGTHGLQWGINFLRGSTSAEVARRAQCPVLAVPTQAKPQPVQKLVFAADLGSLKRTDLRPVEVLAEVFDSELRVVHVIPPSEHFSPSGFDEFKRDFLEQCEIARVSFHLFETDHRKVAEALQNYAEFEGADMVVMTSRPRSLLKRIFQPSQTAHMCINSQVPLLILHEDRD